MTERVFTEEEVQDLTDRVFLLKEQLQAGRIHFAPHLVDDFRRSYEAIRLRADGLVDPATVDGRIRAATLAIRAMKQRDEAKKAISLGEIQDAYFTLLFRQLGWLFDRMKASGATPAQVASAMTSDPKFLEQTMAAIPALAEQLKEFWEAVGEPGAYHLQDGQQLKATFAGDLFPAHWENAVSTAGLYLDTIILPCPITRIAPLHGVLPDREVAALFTKHTLTAMTYREIATANITPPIVLVLPNPDEGDSDNRRQLFGRAEPAMLKHAGYLFDRQFASLDHLRDYCEQLHTVDQVIAELKRPDRLLFDAKWDRDPRAQLMRAMDEHKATIAGMDPSIAGMHVLGTCFGRMPQALGAQENALHFGGIPLVNAETSWLYYQWMLEYDSLDDLADHVRSTGMHVARALVAESGNNLAWLGRVPPETVVEIRKNGLADELRGLLSHGVADLIALKPENYHRTADQVVENLDAAFRKHQQQLLEARQKKLKLYGLDVGSFVATGAIAVTAALTGNPTLGAVSGLLGIAGLPNLKDIKSRFRSIADEDRARRASPTGLLFRHVQSRP